MFRRTKYHIPFPDNELIYLSDLMLRWPFECYLKICFELFKKRLCMYVVTESYRSEDGEVENIIMSFPTSSLMILQLSHLTPLHSNVSRLKKLKKRKRNILMHQLAI